MKRTVTSFLSLAILCFSFLSLPAVNAFAQTILYTQNFDTSSNLPTGWTTTANGWAIGAANVSNNTGASGLNNAIVRNSSPTGVYELVSNPISTIGYTNITFDWGARYTKKFGDSTSTITVMWSVDGNNWNTVTYTENTNDSNWYIDNNGNPIALPSGADNQASLQIKWVANIFSNGPGSSGTYTVDDFAVNGSIATGVAKVANQATPMANVYVVNNTNITINSNNAINEKLSVNVYDVLGNKVKSTVMNSAITTIYAADLSSGVYFVRISNRNRSLVNKVVIK